MKKITLLAIALMMVATFRIQAQETEIVLTQSIGQGVTSNGMSCDGGDNTWYRDYVLADEGIATDVKIVGIQFGVQNTSFPEELEIYAYDFSGFPVGFDSSNPPTPIASGRVTVNGSHKGEMVRADFDVPATVSASSSIVVCIVQSDLAENPLFLSTTSEQTKESFISSENCGIDGEPETLFDVGFPDAKHIINLVVANETLSLNNKLVENVSVFPNPTNDNLNLRLPSHIELLNVKVFDVLGKTVNVLYQNQVLNTISLPQGVYMLKLETSHGSLFKKIVKQ